MSRAGAFLTILMVPLALGVMATGAPAGEPPVLQRGARVRATLGEPVFNGLTLAKSVSGRLVDVTATEILLETSPERPPVVLSLRDVTGLELRTRQGHRNRGARIGSGAVLAAGALFALASNDDREDDSERWQLFTDREGAIILTVVLVPVGALVGALIAPGTQWQTIPSDRIRLGLGRGPSGESRLCATMRF